MHRGWNGYNRFNEKISGDMAQEEFLDDPMPDIIVPKFTQFAGKWDSDLIDGSNILLYIVRT